MNTDLLFYSRLFFNSLTFKSLSVRSHVEIHARSCLVSVGFWVGFFLSGVVFLFPPVFLGSASPGRVLLAFVIIEFRSGVSFPISIPIRQRGEVERRRRGRRFLVFMVISSSSTAGYWLLPLVSRRPRLLWLVVPSLLRFLPVVFVPL